MQSNKMSAWVAAALVAAAVLVGLWLWMGYQPAAAPEVAGPELSEVDTTATIEEELQATDLGDIESEFQDIEAELQNL